MKYKSLENKIILQIIFLLTTALSLNAQTRPIPKLEFESIEITNVENCYGDATGKIKITIKGGTPPFKYLKSAQGENPVLETSTDRTHTFSNLAANVYTIKVEDALGLHIKSIEIITQPNELHIATSEHTNVTGCHGDNNGTITITAEQGTAPYSYLIEKDGTETSSTSGVFQNLSAGKYQVGVKDGKNCEAVGNMIVITEPVKLKITSTSYQDVKPCFGAANGNIEINASGGTLPLQYSINNGADYALTYSFSQLDVGNYQVWVKDANNCTVTDNKTITITQPQELKIESVQKTDVANCFGDHTGKIEIQTSGGSGIVKKSIDGTYFDKNIFDNLRAGEYNIEVKDERGCTQSHTAPVIIAQPAELIITSETAKNIEKCFGDETGEITIKAEGGTNDLVYSIKEPVEYEANEGKFLNLPAGIYQVKVKDENGCVTEGKTYSLSQPAPIDVYGVAKTDIVGCHGDAAGIINVIATGGVGSLKYSIDPIDETHWQDNQEITGLLAGTYTVYVKDQNSCKATYPHEVIIEQPPKLKITNVSTQNPSCFGGEDGQITIEATGGTGTITYSANNLNFFNENTILDLKADTEYKIAVRDDKSCIDTLKIPVTLNNPPELKIDNIQVQDISSCNGEANGSINIIASGGTGQIQYSVEGGVTFSENPLAENLKAGKYIIWIKDNNNCITTNPQETVINEPSLLLINQVKHNNIETCYGDKTGSITIDAMGGTSPLQYSIDGGQTYVANDGIFDEVASGVYNIFVKDANDCKNTNNKPIAVLQPDTLIMKDLKVQNIKCQGDGDGQISIMAEGGLFPCLYSIDGGNSFSASNVFVNLPVGEYNITLKDANNCLLKEIRKIEIIEPPALKIDTIIKHDVTDCYGYKSGSLEIKASGGVPAYTYSINNGTSYNDNNIFDNLKAQKYKVAVKDNNLCVTEKQDFITITQPPQLVITKVNKEDIRCHGEANGKIEIIAKGGSGKLAFSIDNTLTFSHENVFEELLANTYNLCVKDSNNCKTPILPMSIYEPPALVIDTIDVKDEVCIDANDGKITIHAEGGNQPISYSIDSINFVHSPSIKNLSPGKYVATIKDSKNCILQSDTLVIKSPKNSAVFEMDTLIGCSPLTVKFSKPDDGTIFLWDFDDKTTSGLPTPTHTFVNESSAPRKYKIWAYALSENSCKDSTSQIITVEPKPQLKFTIQADTLYFPETTVKITNQSNAECTNYKWNFGDGSPTFPFENIRLHKYKNCGNYTIKMSAENDWCRDTIFTNVAILAHEPIIQFLPDTTNGCFPTTINFSNTSEYALEYEWDFDNNETSNETSPSVTYETPGEYNVILSATGYCDSFSKDSTTITVYNSPILNFDTYPDTIMPPDQPIHCYNYSEGYEMTYKWLFGDSTSSTEESPLHYYKKPGDYQVKLISVSGHKCQDSLIGTKTIHVLPFGEIEFPNAFTPNGDGKNDLFRPAIHQSIADYEIWIYSRTGQVVFHSLKVNEGWDGNFDGNPAPPDVYVWKIVGKFENGMPFEQAGDCTLLR